MNLTPAQAGLDYTTVPLSLGNLTVLINGEPVTPDIDPVGEGYRYTIPGEYVVPPGPIVFMNGTTVFATAVIKS